MKDNITESDFISGLIANKVKCHVYLVNGIKLTGVIVSHDENCLFMEAPKGKGSEGVSKSISLSYKTAVSTIKEASDEK